MQKLSYKHILIFWLPLLATWLMMSVEGPYLAAIIARMAEPKFNLAAYGVAFSLALIFEAPIIMMMSASTALVKDKDSFFKLRNFTIAANIIITLLMLICVIPPLFYFLAETVLELPSNVAELTHIATITLLPWPAAIGFRRFYQGILINSGYTRRVAYGTIIRLVAMSATAFFFYYTEILSGVVVGALALSAGVIAESTATRLMCGSIIKELKTKTKTVDEVLTYKGIYKFYYPLAITAILSLGVHPMVTFFMGKSRMSIESLAVLPVINSLAFIFRSVGLSYQEVIIALVGKKNEHFKELRNFAYGLAVLVVASLGTIAFTDLSSVWFETVSGLSKDLADFAVDPLKIMVIMPALTILISFQRSMLVSTQNTKPITYGSILEVVSIVSTLLITVIYFEFIGVIAATLGFIVGRLASNTYLMPSFLRSIKNS